MKKLMMSFAALLAATGFAFAETEISFTNKLYMEDAFWGHDDAADENVKFFAPVKNKFDLQLESEKLSGQVKGIVYFMDFGGETYGLAGELKDAWVEFRPIEQIGLAFRENIVAWPSTLPIYDDDLQSGNIGSNGFTAWYAPSPLGGALKIAATVPIDWYLNDATYAVVAPNYFNGKDSTYPLTVMVVRKGFAEKNEALLDAFLREYEESYNWTVRYPKAAGELCEKLEFGLAAGVVATSIPRANYVFVSSEYARTEAEKLLNLFLQNDQASIGGKLPDDGFYFR